MSTHTGAHVYAELDSKARKRGLSMSAVATGMGWSRSVFWRWNAGTDPLYKNVMEVHAYLDAQPLHAEAQRQEDLLS